VPKPTNPGRGRSASGASDRLPDTCISCGKPEYPRAARKEGWQDKVEVVFDIDRNGKPFNITTHGKYKDLNRAAKEAVEKWKLAPSESGIKGERASITFQLED
jgi:TonB family protein